MISSFSILGASGDVLIYREFKADTNRRETVEFSNKVVAARDVGQVPPVVTLQRCHFLYVAEGNSC